MGIAQTPTKTGFSLRKNVLDEQRDTSATEAPGPCRMNRYPDATNKGPGA